jgi:hypothetical protein
MQTQQFPGEYEISTDTHRLNVEVIHNFLAEERPDCTIRKAIRSRYGNRPARHNYSLRN